MFPKPKKIRQVYFDHAATTATDKIVVKTMLPYFTDIFGNPSSIYKIGREAQVVINESRKKIADLIHAMPENIIFTGSGSESDNLAIFGIANAHSKAGKHIISLSIEHHAVLYPLQELEKQGFEVTYIKTNQEGIVSIKDVIAAIRKDTILITIMYANNEIGTIEPIAEIGRELLKHRKEKNTVYPYFHTDACQAAGYLNLDVEKLHTDLMTINGSKIYGPKGIGMLYVRRGIKLKPIIYGGEQEKRLRAGTENVPFIVGFTKAFEIAQKNRDKESERIQKLSIYLWQQVSKKIDKVRLNGPEFGNNRLPNNVNITFEDIEGEALLLYLDEYGIMCSTGSACTSESLDPSHVLRAIGLSYEYAHGSLRFSLGKENTKEDINYMMKYLPQIVETLREISPVNMGNQQHPKYKN